MKPRKLLITAMLLLMAMNASAQTSQAERDNDMRKITYDEFSQFIKEQAAGTRDASDNSYNQLIQKNDPVSPQAEEMKKYGEFPMDYSTGVPHISIPIYDIKVGDYTLPVSIAYHASGIKVQEVASPVGLGWSLVAGGSIIRQTKGRVDNGVMNYKSESDIQDYFDSGSSQPIFWSELALGKSLDTESDRYSYNFNGKSGVFRYAVENNMAIKTLPYTPLKIEENGVGYKITDTDGTKYYFMAEEKNRADFTYGGESKTMAWYLTKIEFADKNDSIVFNYTQYNYYYQQYKSEYIHRGNVYSCNPTEYSDNWSYALATTDNSAVHTTECSNLLLSNISWRGNTMNFTYAVDRQDYIMYIQNNKLPRLTTITVKDYNQSTVKTVTFDNAHYDGGTALSYRMFLEGLTITGSSSASGSENYSFDYNAHSLPNYYKASLVYPTTSDTQCHEDYWGYANNTSSTYWTPSAYAISSSYGGNRSINETYAKSGILEKITYPTGGYTTFSFESNRLDNNTLWGGLRLNNSITYDAGGSEISRRTYQYSGAVPAIDNLGDLYQFENYYYFYYHDWAWGRLIHYDVGTLHDVSVSQPLIPLTADNGSPIYYENVTEYYGTVNNNLGKTVYTYADGRTGDRDDYEDTTASSSEGPRTYSKTYNIDQGTISPLLTSKKVYEKSNGSYNLNHSEDYSYDQVTLDGFLAGVHFVSKAAYIDLSPTPGPAGNNHFDDVYTFHNVYAVPSFFRLGSKIVKDYGAQVTTTTTYSYSDSIMTLPKSERVSSVSGDYYEYKYSYPFDLAGYSDLTSANMLIPVQTRTYRNDTLAATTKNRYTLQNGIIVNTGDSISKGTNMLELRAEYAYDSFGNLAYAVKDGTDKVVFLWGYHGLHPVAKIEGMAKQDVYTALGNTITTLAGNPSDSQVHGIHSSLSSGLVTTYAWKPLVGITSMQSPRGENTYFTYDTMGRLASIHDHSHNVIEGYTYNYGTQSYVRRYTITGTGGNSYRETTDYYDAIGRLSETVAKGQSPTGQDLVTLTEYDALNRPIRQWLPTVFSNTGNYISPSTYTSGTRTYYESDSKPYSLTEYEQCPSDKVLKQFGPGSDWQNNNHAIKKVYRGNNVNDSCRIYQVVSDSSLMSTGIYPAGELFTIQTSSEDDNVSYTFTDKEGRLVLERRMNDNARYDTYYVYDLYGNLAFVLPPAASDALKTSNTTWYITTNTVLQQYAYNYQYDSRNRCIKKYLPGCDYIAMTYDTADRMVTRQDGNQRNPDDSKTYYEYDSFGRQTVMGIQTASGSQTPLLTNYYDDYFGLNITGLGYDTSNGGDPAFSSSNAKGLLTGTKIAQLNNTSAEYYTSYYYGKRERLVQSHVQNYLGGLDHEFMTYNFTGTVATRKHIHTATGQSTQTELYTHCYDGVDRLLSTTHQLNNNTAVTLTLNTYDEVGRLATKKPLNIETVTYGYNVRNWLQRISSTHFDQILSYNTTPTGGLSPTYPKFDGSISAMTWRTGNDTDVWGYRFRYYPTGWLRSSTTRLNGSRVHDYDTFYDYDKMGNMTEFYRWGVVDKTLDLYDTVDYPTITYSGNRPTRIDDQDYSLTYPYNGGYHFIDYVQQNSEYTYDDNGNMKQDLNKRISSIQYNLLNLPTNITYSTGSTIAYTYDAAGKKLHVAYGSPNSTTDYCGNMIYENGTLTKILVDGGYITFSGIAPVYHYYLKDHQGNNRVVMSSSGTVEQVNHYFPYGYLFGESTNSGTQKYKYNDKEFDMTHGLHWYDYGARHYDPCIMRFTTMDPMCEKYYNLSPYAYCGNNPVNAVDPSGMDWVKTPNNDYLWMDNVTSYKDVPYGYSYIGTTGKDILTDLNINSDFNAQTSVGVSFGVDGDEKLGGAIMASRYELTGSVGVSAMIEINPKNGYSNNSMGISFKGIKFEANFNQKGFSTSENTSQNYKGNMELKVNDMTIYSPLFYSGEPQLQQAGSFSLKAVKEFSSNELKNNLIFWEVGITVGSPNPKSLYTKTDSFSWNLLKQPIILQR